jgi:ubiquinone/menaquinone biosynthesis C-methylase UbiE
MTLQKDVERNETKYLHRLAAFEGKRVLEIGCGEGRLTWKYAQETLATVGIDPDKDALRVAMADRPAGLEKKVCFSLGTSEQLPFSKEAFDLAVFAWSF